MARFLSSNSSVMQNRTVHTNSFMIRCLRVKYASIGLYYFDFTAKIQKFLVTIRKACELHVAGPLNTLE